MDLKQAIDKHAEWKVKFRSAISKHESMDVSTISKDDCCDLGRWLHGDGMKRHGKLDSFKQCVTKHAAFHVEAGKVAQTINAKKYDDAEKMLSSGTPYTSASTSVGAAILQLKKESGL